MSLITLFIPRILLLNTTNINLAYYHSWSGIGEYYRLIILKSWKILYSNYIIDRVILKVIYTFFLYYLLAISFVMFQKIYINDASIFRFGFIIFALATLIYNLSISNIVISMLKTKE